MTIKITPIGKRHDRLGKEFEATGIRHEPNDWDTRPTGHLFPEGAIFQTADGEAYEVVTPRIIQERRSTGELRYIHVYICRPADPEGVA